MATTLTDSREAGEAAWLGWDALDALDSRALEADSRQTDLRAYLSAILLGGLLLNALLGWWWADPVAGLVMVPIIAGEGREALRGERCESCAGPI